MPMPAGLSGCTFDAGLTLQGGVLVAAGPPIAAGQQYPVALVLRCLSPGGICSDSYLAVYSYSTATRTLRWVMNKVALQGLCHHACWTAGSPPASVRDGHEVSYTSQHGHVLHPAGLSAKRTCRRCAHSPTLQAPRVLWYVELRIIPLRRSALSLSTSFQAKAIDQLWYRVLRTSGT